MSAHPDRRTVTLLTNVLYAIALGVVILFAEPAADAVSQMARQSEQDGDAWKQIEQAELLAAQLREACPNSDSVMVDGEPVCLPRRKAGK
jgi:hypothetical protein